MLRLELVPDFLVEAKKEVDPFSFRQVFDAVFLEEHGCKQLGEIASILGLSCGRASQIRSNPDSLSPSTFRSVLRHLRNERNRQNLVAAWTAATFDVSVFKGVKPKSQYCPPSENSLCRIDWLLENARISEAANLALETAKKEADWDIRHQCFDRAFFARIKLNQPGRAVQVADLIVDDLFEEVRTARQATAQYYKLTALRISRKDEALQNQLTNQLWNGLEYVRSLAHMKLRCVLVRRATIERHWNNDKLESYESRESIPYYVDLVKDQLQAVHRARIARTPLSRFRQYIYASRIALRRGEADESKSLFDLAFRSGDFTSLSFHQETAILRSRIMTKLLMPEEALNYLQHSSASCERSMNYYDMHQIECEIARFRVIRSDSVSKASNGATNPPT